jgi:hypothetical protein
MNKFDKQNKIEMSLLNKYIKRKNISKRLRTHILDYLGYIHDQTEYFQELESIDNIIQKLPENLQYDLKKEISHGYERYFEETIFSTSFSPKTY